MFFSIASMCLLGQRVPVNACLFVTSLSLEVVHGIGIPAIALGL